MSAALIGTLLDAAMDYPRYGDPSNALPFLPRLGVVADAPRIFQQEAARLALINHLRLSRLPPGETDADDEDECDTYDVEPLPTYRELVRSLISSKLAAPLARFKDTAAPDLIIHDDFGVPGAALEIGYGFESGEAMAAIDRLLHFAWATRLEAERSGSYGMVGYLFVCELKSGETIRDTESSINEWIGAHYGPFNGLDRIALPMMPRLTRTSSMSAHGNRWSAIGPNARPTGYVAFCVSYEHSGF